MICHECKENPATVYFTKIINGEKTEISLCEKCAHEKSEMFMFGSNSNFSVNDLLSGILKFGNNYELNSSGSFENKSPIRCEQCSMTIQQFAKVGRFGCVGCYDAFSEQLKPILKRLHGGNLTHNGKIPARIGGDMHIRKQIEVLKNKLQELISREEFEEAALVRDEIREHEKEMDSKQMGGE